MERSTWSSPKRSAVARELLRGQRAGLEEHLLRRLAGRLRLLNSRLHALLGREAELNDDVGDETPAAPTLARRGQTVGGFSGKVYGCSCCGTVAAGNRLEVWSV
jgi:hypothetical protein